MSQKSIFKSLLLAAAGALASVAIQVHAQDQDRERGDRMPPELRAQLSADQIAQLEAATSFEQKKQLLDSWGIKPPKHRRGDHHGPPPPRDGEDQQQDGSQGSGGQQ